MKELYPFEWAFALILKTEISKTYSLHIHMKSQISYILILKTHTCPYTCTPIYSSHKFMLSPRINSERFPHCLKEKSGCIYKYYDFMIPKIITINFQEQWCKNYF